nr:MAG TPA: hypothetical protein [Bacteriophage sp.]DAY36449.1 MAG TPA: hypothetical protein [Bacteriophage sp.]
MPLVLHHTRKGVSFWLIVITHCLIQIGILLVFVKN